MFIEINKRKLKNALLSFGGICMALAAVVMTLQAFNLEGRSREAVSSEITNWGLSFQEEGKLPVGNASVDQLKEYAAYYAEKTDKKIIYLTFDAGYENGYMGEILEVLREEKVPAAFFLVGSYIRDNPKLVKEMVKDGHIVGNHTMTHPDMSKISSEAEFSKELSQVEKLYKETTGKTMRKYYRPPQGKFSISNLTQAKGLGYTTVFWSLAYVDWYVDNQPTREEALEKLIPRTHKGAIVLLHSTSKTKAQILKELITIWKEEGYQFMSLEKLGNL